MCVCVCVYTCMHAYIDPAHELFLHQCNLHTYTHAHTPSRRARQPVDRISTSRPFAPHPSSSPCNHVTAVPPTTPPSNPSHRPPRTTISMNPLFALSQCSSHGTHPLPPHAPCSIASMHMSPPRRPRGNAVFGWIVRGGAGQGCSAFALGFQELLLKQKKLSNQKTGTIGSDLVWQFRLQPPLSFVLLSFLFVSICVELLRICGFGSGLLAL